MRFLRFAFWTTIGGWALLFPLILPTPLTWPLQLTWLAGAVLFVIGGFAYLIALGLLAHRSGHSWIVWVGLTLITSPLGILFSYPIALTRLLRP
jgi:hypothetical protein